MSIAWQFALSIGTILLLDAVYLSLVRDTFVRMTQSSIVRWYAAAVAYGMLATFVVGLSRTVPYAFSVYFIIGCLLYGLYDFTNLATLPFWTLSFAVQDTLWGGLIVALTGASLAMFGK